MRTLQQIGSILGKGPTPTQVGEQLTLRFRVCCLSFNRSPYRWACLITPAGRERSLPAFFAAHRGKEIE